MTTDELTAKIEKLLKKEFPGSSVGQVSDVEDEHVIGFEFGDRVWFIVIQEG